MKPKRVFFAALVVSFSLVLVLGGCDHKDDRPFENLRPTVKVSGGPPNGGTANYTIPIYWFGADADGVVDYFLYAIDDTSSWTETRFFQGSFLFAADTARASGDFGQWHTFYIKSVDNEGLESFPDYLTFDARTVAPETQIRSPVCDPTETLCMGALPLGTSVKVIWDGEDPDSRDPTLNPVAYKWRLFNTSLLNPMGVDLETLLLTYKDGEGDPNSFWSAPTPQTEIIFPNLAAGIFWQFGVLAIDEAGAVEPRLRMNHNLIFFKTMPYFGSPTLCVYEGASGHCYPTDGSVWERQAAVGKPITFRWEGDASAYGGTISGYMYGLDIEDLSDPTEWALETWSLEATSATIQFDEPGVHYFYVKVKDYADVEQLGIVEVEVVDFLFDRSVLYVDDYYDVTPTDPQHDNFMRSILGCCRALDDTVYSFNCWLPGAGGVPPEMPSQVQYPTLSELSRYRLLIWDSNASWNSFVTGLSGVIQNGILDVYLKGGGNLWLYGMETVRGSATDPLSFAYGTVPGDNTFARRYLKISGIVNRPVITTSNRGDGFRGAWPYRKLGDNLPSLDSLDYSKGGTSTVYGMTKVEAITTAMQDPAQEQRPDTVYFYKANYSSSTYNKKACALRFHDVYTGSKVMWMGFPIHTFFEARAESLACFVTDWVFSGL
ncbi:MAG: hypothetical protein JW952_07750 [Candidatus Eisenbacteria bacterium]|nr:hypothetical protein [Candidatus Eisenbacteria bacterium]